MDMRGYVLLPYPLYLDVARARLGPPACDLGCATDDPDAILPTVRGRYNRGTTTTHSTAVALALALVAVFPPGASASASLDDTAVRRHVLSVRHESHPVVIPFHAQKIVLAALLGGVPTLGVLMTLGLCLWARTRRRAVRRHARAHGVALDADGWPVDRDRDYGVAHDLALVARAQAGGAAARVSVSVSLPSGSVDSKDASPPPPYHRPTISPPAPGYTPASSSAHFQPRQQHLLAVPGQAGPHSGLTDGEGTSDSRGIRQSIIGVAI